MSYGDMSRSASYAGDSPQKFTGKELDDGTGLYYFGARYYDVTTGRWLVHDPAGQYFSPYAYGSSPLMYVDPNGEFGISSIYGIYMAGKAFYNAYQAYQYGGWGYAFGAAVRGSIAYGAGQVAGFYGSFANIATGSQIAGLATSSSINSFVNNGLNGKIGMTTNLGIGDYDWGSGKYSLDFNWKNPTDWTGALYAYGDVVRGWSYLTDVGSQKHIAGPPSHGYSYNKINPEDKTPHSGPIPESNLPGVGSDMGFKFPDPSLTKHNSDLQFKAYKPWTWLNPLRNHVKNKGLHDANLRLHGGGHYGVDDGINWNLHYDYYDAMAFRGLGAIAHGLLESGVHFDEVGIHWNSQFYFAAIRNWMYRSQY